MILGAIGFLGDLLIFFIILSVLILIHELGHFAMAKLFGVYCYEFSLGMGPLIWQHHGEGKETKYSLRALPIGGYVSMAGEELDDENMSEELKANKIDVPYERTINGVASWKKMIIVIAGVVMNFFLSLVLYMILYGSMGIPTNKIEMGISSNSLAYEVGLRSGDQIQSIHTVLVGEENKEYTCTISSGLVDCITEYSPNKDYTVQEYTFTILRDGEELSYDISRSYDVDTKKISTMGITFGNVYKDAGFFETIKYSFKYEGYAIKTLFVGVGSLFTKEGWAQVGGPVAIFEYTQEAANAGIFSVLSLAAALSANLGVINLLPIPALDGARFLTSAWETITKKKVNQKVEAIINSIGMIFLMGLMVVILFKDIFFR